MIKAQYLTLISLASDQMKQSHDPIHDYDHVFRVVQHTQSLTKQTDFTEKEKQSLIIAAWWHDVGRTITKQPSFIWMPLIDDILSAILLIKTIIKKKIWSPEAWLAIKIILSKSTATGTFFRRLLLRRNQHVLADILKDADALDLLNSERTKQIQLLVNTSLLYTYGYRLQAWWFITCRQIKFKTEAAKQQFIKLLKEFLTWISEETTIMWHKHTFGDVWADNMLTDLRQLIKQFEPQHD